MTSSSIPFMVQALSNGEITKEIFDTFCRTYVVSESKGVLEDKKKLNKPKKKKRVRVEWSLEEDDRLLFLHGRNMSINGIANQLNRRYQSVWKRLRKLRPIDPVCNDVTIDSDDEPMPRLEDPEASTIIRKKPKLNSTSKP